MKSRMFSLFGAILCLILLSLVGPVKAATETTTIPQRSDIENRYKWDLEKIYPDRAAWESDFETLAMTYPRLEYYKGRLSESSEMIYECLRLSDSINVLMDKLSTYTGLKLSEDNRVGEWQELRGRIRGLRSKVRHASSFIEPELLEIGPDKLNGFLREDRRLDLYHFYISDLIRRHKYVLSQPEEAIMALTGMMADSPDQIYSMLVDADMSFGSIYDEDSNLVQLTEERYDKFRTSPDRRVRRDAHKEYYGTYEKFANTMAASLDGSLRKDYFYTKARGYESSLQMSLFRNNIPLSVYYNLIETVNNNLGPLHKWAALKKRILGYDTLYPYDLYVPLVSEQNREYSYEEAESLVVEGISIMGEPYVSDFKRGLKSGWVDVYETEGKSSGAFSGGSYATSPYVLLNFNGTIGWVFTLAHEMGHSMQSYYVNRNEPYIYADYTTFVAEVASTFDETLLMKYLLNNAKSKQEKMFLINLYLTNIRTTFFRQVMFAEFELAIHNHIEQGGAVSADYFRSTFANIYKKYWGDELTVDSLNSMLSMAVPHFYWQYYVYQYATCFAAAQLMAQKVYDNRDYVHTYMHFLATGSSEYPVDVLKDAGVDMTQPEPILYTIHLFSDLVAELEKLLDEK